MADPSITIWFTPSYSIELNLTLFGTADAICANALKLNVLLDLIDLLNFNDFKIIPISLAYLFFSKVFNWWAWTTWS